MTTPNDIPRRTTIGANGETMVELSDVYMHGTRKMQREMTPEAIEEYIQDQGIRTLPDMSVAIDPVMTVEQCREMFRTATYAPGVGEALGFTMR